MVGLLDVRVRPWMLLGAVALAGTMAGDTGAKAANPALPFYENFEPVPGQQFFKDEWHALEVPFDTECSAVPPEDYCPNDPAMPAPSQGWGPVKFETWPDVDNGGPVFSGQRSGRQPIFDPYWVSIYHVFDSLAGPDTRDLRLKTMYYDPADILCDCDQGAQLPGYQCDCSTIGTNPPPRASRPNFDVHGWVFLSTPDRSEYFIFAVNTKQSWDHYVWSTKTDGWQVTNVPRTRGWKRVDIVVHPYTGNVGDVEFLLNGQVVAQGRRQPGAGQGVPVVWLRLGGDPAVITESSLTNTFEEFWYDEVALTACHNPRADADGDGSVDQSDFGQFQVCWAGAGDPFTLNEGFDGNLCQCMDADGDKDVDADDFTVFTGCFSGASIPADPDCDH